MEAVGYLFTFSHFHIRGQVQKRGVLNGKSARCARLLDGWWWTDIRRGDVMESRFDGGRYLEGSWKLLMKRGRIEFEW